jgi:hypothetical protein
MTSQECCNWREFTWSRVPRTRRRSQSCHRCYYDKNTHSIFLFNYDNNHYCYNCIYVKYMGRVS